MNRQLYGIIVLPAVSLALFIAELLRSHGLEALTSPPVFGAAVLIGTAAVAAGWIAYSLFLTSFAAIDLQRALLLDALCHVPLLCCLSYFVPGVSHILNVGTWLFVASLAGLALSRIAFLLYARRSRVAALLSRPHLAIALVIALAALIRVSLIAVNRFHGDEALYCHWGLLIASGKDIFLRQGVIVDKPPVFLYTLALFFRLFGPNETAARLPNIMASLASIAIICRIVARLTDGRAAVLSALLLALSPFDIQFAPTAFTDPMMVFLVLASYLLALRGPYFLAGVAAGLAVMTKPTAIFFLPLLAFFVAQRFGWPWRGREFGKAVLRLALGFLIVGLAVVLWDVLIRIDAVNFASASAQRYGGLRIAPAARLLPRFQGWLRQLQYVTGSPFLDGLLLVGLPFLLGYGWWRRRERDGWLLDWVLAAFLIYYVAVHTVLSFSIWDRYMLGLAPVLAVLLARISLLPYDALRDARPLLDRPKTTYLVILGAVLCLALLPPTQMALRYGFPVGGDHGAFQGIDDVADFFRARAQPGSIVFHRWLGWHYSFYMFGLEVEYYYYPDHQFVLNTARRLPYLDKYVVFPSWTSPEALDEVLSEGGWELRELYRTYRPDGTLSFTIYEVRPRTSEAR
jgi:hypothetical protein